MLVCAATPCGNVLATRVIHYYDNLLHACLRSVTLRKRFDNRLIHYCDNILHACSCSVTLRKSIASRIQTAIAACVSCARACESSVYMGIGWFSCVLMPLM